MLLPCLCSANSAYQFWVKRDMLAQYHMPVGFQMGMTYQAKFVRMLIFGNSVIKSNEAHFPDYLVPVLRPTSHQCKA